MTGGPGSPFPVHSGQLLRHAPNCFVPIRNSQFKPDISLQGPATGCLGIPSCWAVQQSSSCCSLSADTGLAALHPADGRSRLARVRTPAGGQRLRFNAARGKLQVIQFNLPLSLGCSGSAAAGNPLNNLAHALTVLHNLLRPKARHAAAVTVLRADAALSLVSRISSSLTWCAAVLFHSDHYV